MRKLLIVPCVALVAYAAAAVPPPNLERAITAQQELAKRQPSAEVWNDLGNLLQLAGRNADAQATYETALVLDDRLVSAHYNMGLLLRQAGDERQAMSHFRRVVELAPTDAWGWFQIGALNEARGARGSAIEAYARAFALDPRLSFTDVNPQVIDSELTTESLLQAQGERPAASEAARAYEDPRHIAKLLLPQPPPATAAPAAAAPADVATGRAAPAAPPLGADQRVLRPQDLQAGSKVGGVTRAGPAQGGDHGSPDSAYNDPAYGDLLRQQLELQQQQQQELEGGEPVELTPPGVYNPDVRSSGQIEQKLEDLLG